MKILLVFLFAAASCIPARTTPERPQFLTAIKKPDKLDVIVMPAGAVAWSIRATNGRDSIVHLVWDESSFVDGNGHSYGRLMRGQTRIFDDTKPQMPSVIMPGSSIDEFCIPESPPAYNPDELTGDGKAPPLPAAVTRGIGRMILTFETDGGAKEIWEGALDFESARKQAQKDSNLIPGTTVQKPAR